MVQEGMLHTLQETGDVEGLSPSTSKMVTLQHTWHQPRVPTKSSPSTVCWHWATHAGVWLEADDHCSWVLLAFTFMFATTIRGGACFEVGWAAHICGGCTGRHFGWFASSGWFSLCLASVRIRVHVCWPSIDRCWVLMALSGVLRPFCLVWCSLT